jgi:hypothetical protein
MAVLLALVVWHHVGAVAAKLDAVHHHEGAVVGGSAIGVEIGRHPQNAAVLVRVAGVGDGQRVFAVQRVPVAHHGRVVFAARGQTHRQMVLPGRHGGGRRDPLRARGLAAITAADPLDLHVDAAAGDRQNVPDPALDGIRALARRVHHYLVTLARHGHAALGLHVEVNLRPALLRASNHLAGDAIDHRLGGRDPRQIAPRPLDLPDVHRIGRLVRENGVLANGIRDGQDRLPGSGILDADGGNELRDIDGEPLVPAQHQADALAIIGHLVLRENGVARTAVGPARGDVARGDVVGKTRVPAAQVGDNAIHVDGPVAGAFRHAIRDLGQGL